MQEVLYRKPTDPIHLTVSILAVAVLISSCLSCAKSKTGPITIEQPPSHITIRAAQPEEEFDVVWRTVTQRSLCRNYGYNLTLPNHEIFRKLVKLHPVLREAEKTTAQDLFWRRLYRAADYEKGLILLAAIKKNFIPIFSRFIELHQQWGFKIYPHYEILLSRYGPASQFNPQSGKIIIKTDKSGKFEGQNAFNSIVQQMVHLGIHDTIAETYQLTHGERERLTDLICSIYFGDILNDYKMQALGDKHLDPFITAKLMPHLTQAIKTYIQKYPRESDYGPPPLKTSGVDFIVIKKVFPHTQASNVGLNVGDIIVLYDQKRFASPQQFSESVKKKHAKDKVELVIIRNGMMIRFMLKGGPIGIQIGKMSIYGQRP